MTKERLTVSVDEDVAEYLQQESVNASGLVNKLVTNYLNGGGNTDEILEFRKEQVRSDYEELAARARRKIEELNELERREECDNDVSDEERRETLQKVRQVPRDQTHPIVVDAAETLDTTPENVIAEVYNE